MSFNQIPQQQKACVITGPNQFSVQTISVPTPKPTEVLCKIRAVAICGSDPGIIRGDHFGTFPQSYPFIAGHEWAGEVVAVGSEIHEFKPGDRVAGESHKGCGYCENCKRGRYNLCLNYGKIPYAHQHYGHNTNGAYCQYQVIAVSALSHLPDNVSFAEGSMCDTASVALHGLELIGVTVGGTIVIIGPGPIGLSAMRLAKISGASRVIVIGRGKRLQMAKMLGADEIVDINEVIDPVQSVWKLTNGIGADEVIECSGAPDTLNQAVKMLRKGGKAALVGLPKNDDDVSIPHRYVAMNEITVIGSRANPNTSSKILNLLASRRLIVEDFITHRFLLEDFGLALDTFVHRKGGAVKVVIFPNGFEGAE